MPLSWHWLRQAGTGLLVTVLLNLVARSAAAGRWDDDMAAAASAHRRGDLARAEQHLRSALRLAEQQGSDRNALAETLQALALVLFEGQDFEGDSPPARTRRRPAGRRHAEDEPRLAVLLNSLGLIRTRLGESDEAMAAYHRALALFAAQHGTQDERVGRVSANLAGLHMAEGRYPKAE